jgi:hypothetical protein
MRVTLILSLALVLAGCGDPAAMFAGAWTCSTTITVTDRFGVNRFVDNGTWTVSELSNGEIAVSEDSIKSCPPVKLKVSGDTASLEPGQICNVSDGTIVTYVSLQATSDGKTLTMDNAATTQFGTDNRISSCHR